MRLERSDWSGGGLAFLRHTRDIKPTAFLKTGRGGSGGTERAVRARCESGEASLLCRVVT